MSSAEAEERLRAILAAAALIADQMRRLSGARIEDAGEVRAELTDAVEKLSPRQIADRVAWMLESRVALLDEPTASEFVRILAAGQFIDGRNVLPRSNRAKTDHV